MSEWTTEPLGRGGDHAKCEVCECQSVGLDTGSWMKVHIINMLKLKWSDHRKAGKRPNLWNKIHSRLHSQQIWRCATTPTSIPLVLELSPISSQCNPSSRARHVCGGSYIDMCSLRDEVLHHIPLTKVGGIVQGYPPRTLLQDPVDVFRLQKSNTLNATKINKEHIVKKKKRQRDIWGYSFFFLIKESGQWKESRSPEWSYFIANNRFSQRLLHPTGLTFEWIWMHEQLSGEFRRLQ